MRGHHTPSALSAAMLALGVLLPLTACSSGGGGSSDSGVPNDATMAPDGGPADASPDTTGGGDSSSPAVLDDGQYNATAWTCSGDAGAIDVKAYAVSIGIDQVHFTVNGMMGQTDAIYTGVPPCTRTIPFALTYPSSGTFTTTSATAYTCSATCTSAKCTPGSQPSIVDTFAFTKTMTGFSATRTLGAPIGLQLAAGCQAGGNESITWTKL